jgi:hypothetical protein
MVSEVAGAICCSILRVQASTVGVAMSGCTLLGEICPLPGDRATGEAGQLVYRGVAERQRGVERRSLVKPVIQRIKQRAVDAEVRPQSSLAIAEDVVGYPDARLGHELCPVFGESGAADGGIGVDDAVGEAVVRCAAVGLIPAVGRLGTEAGAKLEARRYLPGVLDKARCQKRPPAQFRGRRHNRKRRDASLQKAAEGGERCLSILVLSQVVIRLQPLQPYANLELVPSAGPENMFVHGEEVAHCLVVAAGVRARQRDLGGAIRCGASRDHNGADWLAGDPARHRHGAWPVK